MNAPTETAPPSGSVEVLVQALRQLSLTKDLSEIMSVVRSAARRLVASDGATFVLREGDLCYYADEDAIAPLWKGSRFPMSACVSGWSMVHAENVAIPDVFADPRIPVDAYRPTFVKSLVMVPIRSGAPIGAIGTYWAGHHAATADEIRLLATLADATSVAIANVELVGDLRRALDQSHVARAEVERQLSLRDEFILIASHEFKTPLTSLAMQVQYVRELLDEGLAAGLPVEGELRTCLAISDQGVNDLSSLFADVIDVSSIRLGRFELRRSESVDLGVIVSRAVGHARVGYGAEIRCDLPAHATGAWDRARLGQVVHNLLSNAVKFGESRDIDVRVTADARTVELSVRDRGIGIAEEDHQRVFERFDRAVSARRYRGMGLGLFITREIVQAHGGTVTVESREREGATFTVRLPRA